MLDNPWGVAYTRARRAGRLLARALLSRAQGAPRPPLSLSLFHTHTHTAHPSAPGLCTLNAVGLLSYRRGVARAAWPLPHLPPRVCGEVYLTSPHLTRRPARHAGWFLARTPRSGMSPHISPYLPISPHISPYLEAEDTFSYSN